MIKYDEPEEGGGNDICVDSNGKPTKTKQPGNGLKSKYTEDRLLESTNTAPSNLKYNISMKGIAFTYHLA